MINKFIKNELKFLVFVIFIIATKHQLFVLKWKTWVKKYWHETKDIDKTAKRNKKENEKKVEVVKWQTSNWRSTTPSSSHWAGVWENVYLLIQEIIVDDSDNSISFYWRLLQRDMIQVYKYLKSIVMLITPNFFHLQANSRTRNNS